ncbi:lipopolysaccharide transport periplasmic protein LptA [Psychromonas sp. RZ22]|uniref:lipopolysaccharide transport periplasmic protein LptA n=1 Tax=Psychromonas algarum TaxID=2555643 RepID=UPI00106756F1|nr:lipopolysaccharide transport periplasmic protein LptA [Psychromonas sp. RZ22]TEW56657.1 lipopolysaccharide transport periplasmic protein LptA [Psychromonas sp. RZ22]
MKLNKLAVLLIISVLSSNGLALESDFDQPIHVSSVKQHAQMKTNTITFTNEVILTQGSIKITADKLTVIRGSKPNHEIMIAEGNVATFYQTQDDGKPLDAEANKITYNVAEGKVTLTKNAQVKQLDSQVNGTEIVYLLGTQELNVATDRSKKERVQTVFLPAQFQKDKSEEKNNSSSSEKNKEK